MTITSPQDPAAAPAVHRPRAAAAATVEGGTAAVAHTPRIPHVRALDGVRGFAVVLAVTAHFVPGIAPGGFLGVDLFFVLSGFLITSLLVAEHESTGSLDLRRFWTRRARRLLPALLGVLAAVLVVEAVRGSGSTMHRVGLDGLASLFYVANWRFIATGQSYVLQFVAADPSPLRHTWSLAIEEQFYVVWPLVVAAAASIAARTGGPGQRRGRLRVVLACTCAVLATASAGWMIVEAARGADLDRLYYGTDTRVWMILLGAVLGALTAGRPALRGRGRAAAVVVGSVAALGLVAAVAVVHSDTRRLYELGYPLIGLLLCGLVLGATQPGRNPLARTLSWSPLIGLGLISYGVYLWHWPIAVWLDADRLGTDGPLLFAARTVVTLAVALLGYRFVERPIRRQGLAAFSRLRPVVAPVAVGAAAIALLVPVLAFPEIPASPGETDAQRAADVTAAYGAAPRCDGPAGAPLDATRPLTFQLIGNSLAGEVRSCLATILGERGVRHVTVSTPGSPICADAPAIEAQAADPATRPDFAVLFAFLAADTRCGEPWHRTVDELIDTWISLGTHVYLVPSVPVAPGGRQDLEPAIEVEQAYYRDRAAADPEHLTYVDAGRYLRDADGTYMWRMPCLADGEAGCGDDGTVGVRFVDGIHFCSDPEFEHTFCTDPAAAAGERRAAAAIAQAVVSTWPNGANAVSAARGDGPPRPS